MNFIEIFETATTKMCSLLTALGALLVVSAGIWIAFFSWIVLTMLLLI